MGWKQGVLRHFLDNKQKRKKFIWVTLIDFLRAWWKKLPAVDREKGSGRRGPLQPASFYWSTSTSLPFSSQSTSTTAYICASKVSSYFLQYLANVSRKLMPFSTGRRQPSCLFLVFRVNLPFSTYSRRPGQRATSWSMVDARRRPFYSPFYHAPFSL